MPDTDTSKTPRRRPTAPHSTPRRKASRATMGVITNGCEAIFQAGSDSGGSAATCYTGILGRCQKCNSDGSCICAGGLNGMSDLLVMDRQKWGDRTLLCPNYEPLLIIINAAACLFALLALPRILRAIHFQAVQAGSRVAARQPVAPFVVLSGALLGTISMLSYSALKLIFPARVVGTDPTISLMVVLRDFSSAVALEAHRLHVVSVALGSQTRSLGEQRVQDAKAYQLWRCAAKATIFSLLGLLPLVQCMYGSAGRATSVEAQTAFAVAFLIGKVVHFSSTAVILRAETNSLLKSFSECIEAAHAGYVIASGGNAHEALMSSSPKISRQETSADQTRKRVPQQLYLQPLLNELHALQAARENIRTNARGLVRTLSLSTCAWLTLAVCPPFWTKISYFIPLISLMWLNGSVALVKLYGSRRKP